MFQQASDADVSRVDILLQFCSVLEHKGRVSAAIAVLQQGLLFRPSNFELLMKLADITAASLGDAGKAMELYSRALASNPSSIEADRKL